MENKINEIYDVIIDTLPQIIFKMFGYELASLDNEDIAERLCSAIADKVNLN